MATSNEAQRNHDALFPNYASTLKVTDPELVELSTCRCVRGRCIPASSKAGQLVHHATGHSLAAHGRE
jgi:hypothetical protein